MGGRTFQNFHVVNALPTEAGFDYLYNGGVATDVVNLGKYEKATWVISRGAGATGTALIQVQSCDDVTPSTTTAIPFTYQVAASGDTFAATATAVAAGYTTAAGAGSVVVVEINAAELSGTNKYARLIATEVVNDPVSGSVACIMSGGTVVQDIPPTAIV